MTTNLSKQVFGTDGVRGKANIPPMTVETALALGRAAGKLMKRHNGKHRIVVGKDTRLSCYMFENALIAGLCSMGVDTYMLGPLPTPAVAFITRAYRADAGIVISASHNPFYDNGIKFFSSEGFKLSDLWEKEMEEMIAQNDFTDSLPADNEVGKNTKIDDAAGRYIEYVKSFFPRRETLAGIKIALDCANGAGYRVAPHVFKELDAQVFVTGDKPNGLNINYQCGSLYPEHVRRLVLENGGDVGIALDGDADRVIMIDEKGEIIDGDVILAICARDMKERGKLFNNTVVATVMSNFGFFKAMEDLGIEVVKSRVGDRYVIEEMLKHECNLGGEQSGHLIFLDQNSTGDGIVSALQVLRIMKETRAKLSQLAKVIKKYPQTIHNVSIGSKPPIENLDLTKQAIRSVEEALGDHGRVLVRYSGTEMILRVMVEGPEKEMIERMAQQIVDAIEKEIAKG